MASPEVGLAQNKNNEFVEDDRPPSPTIADTMTEKKDHPSNDSSSSSSSSTTSLPIQPVPSSPLPPTQDLSTQEITPHYLTFTTDLPQPLHLYLPSSSLDQVHPSSLPPPCPDLKKFTSPFLWSPTRKRIIVHLSCAATALTAYAAGSYSSATAAMSSEWHVSRVAANLGITVYTCGFGIAPMVLAPFSEINGRKPVFVATGVMFVVFQLICALTPTYAGMIVTRFLTGCAGSTFSTMVGGVIADIFNAEERNSAMAMFSGSALLGTGLGPLISGFIAERAGSWRWVFWVQVIASGVLMAAVVVFFKETRGSVLLSRKAKVVNRWYEELEGRGFYGVMLPEGEDGKLVPRRIRWKVEADEERGSVFQMIRISVVRPFYMLVTEPVIFFFSLWATFSWAVLYLTLSAVPLIFQTTYHFDLEEAEAVFAAMVVGSLIFTFVAIYQEKYARKHMPSKRELFDAPEGRLYFTCVESALLPIGCLWFCISGAYPSVPWIVPALGVVCATMGIFSIYLAVFNYLADSYHKYASSALAAQSFCRNMIGGSFPLYTDQMFKAMTFQGAGGFLGGIGFLLTIVPWVLLLYGPQIRARSKLASELFKQQN